MAAVTPVDTSPAGTLRRAATHLRALATTATTDTGSSNWATQQISPAAPAAGSVYLRPVGGTTIINGGSFQRPPRVTTAVGEYIAALDPCAGLLLADLFTEVAESLEQDGAPIENATDDAVFTLALAVLGEQR